MFSTKRLQEHSSGIEKLTIHERHTLALLGIGMTLAQVAAIFDVPPNVAARWREEGERKKRGILQ